MKLLLVVLSVCVSPLYPKSSAVTPVESAIKGIEIDEEGLMPVVSAPVAKRQKVDQPEPKEKIN